MKITVLIDNNTLIDRYFIGEPGVSYFIEADGIKVLFDVGYSDAFIKNAGKLSIDLCDIDYLVLSHGHLDHTWGLTPLIRLYTESIIEGHNIKKPTLVSHPQTFSSKSVDGIPEIGVINSVDQISKFFNTNLSKKPVILSPNLIFLGEIERTNDFEAKIPVGKTVENGTEKDDLLFDDSALVYKSNKGLIIITGCSHSGICNIVQYAQKVCKTDKVIDIIGGFHLLNPPERQLKGTIDLMKRLNPDSVHACHCTDLKSKIELAKVVNLEEVGVGMEVEY